MASLAGAHQTACQAELLARQRRSLLQQTSHYFCLDHQGSVKRSKKMKEAQRRLKKICPSADVPLLQPGPPSVYQEIKEDQRRSKKICPSADVPLLQPGPPSVYVSRDQRRSKKISFSVDAHLLYPGPSSEVQQMPFTQIFPSSNNQNHFPSNSQRLASKGHHDTDTKQIPSN